MSSKNRWFRISLSKLLLLIALACVCLAIYANVVVRGQAQQAAITNFINSERSTLRGSKFYKALLVYDFEMDAYNRSGRGMFSRKPSLPWLARVLGVDYVQNIELVDFDVLADDELVKQTQRFPGLKKVIVDCGFTGQAAWDALVRCRSLEELQYVIYWHENVPITFRDLAKLDRLREFQVSNGELDGENLAEIAAAKSIKTLRLIDVHIKRFNLLEFPKMDQIESFFWKIAGNTLDDEELRFLRKIPRLEKMALAGPNELTDNAFQTIEKLTRLQELSIHGTKMTGSELDRLKQLPNLVKLELGASLLNDDALDKISQLDRLKHLEIGSTNVTDEGMQFISKLNQLKHLSIRDTEVSDDGLIWIAKLPNLKRLRIRDTRISENGIAEFKKKRPDCLVERK